MRDDGSYHHNHCCWGLVHWDEDGKFWPTAWYLVSLQFTALQPENLAGHTCPQDAMVCPVTEHFLASKRKRKRKRHN